MVTVMPSGQEVQRTDAELVALCTHGNPDAFHTLTVRYYRAVCGFLYKKLQRPDLVEDLAQETFLEAYRGLKDGSEPHHFSSWLFGIAVNRCGKWLRRKRPALFDATEPPDTASVPFVSPQEELEEQRKLFAGLEAGLASLPEEIRTLLHMKHHQSKTCEQIAAELGQPVGTIKSQLSRTYKALRARLSRPGDDPR
ncbi:MAG TPA: RNA polymerase sigma factor [Gemmataceae bacterium]|nr:RNA polymerase sigma factor [Gemmataceae bacterium]